MSMGVVASDNETEGESGSDHKLLRARRSAAAQGFSQSHSRAASSISAGSFGRFAEEIRDDFAQGEVSYRTAEFNI
jgi:hypothetical protein